MILPAYTLVIQIRFYDPFQPSFLLPPFLRGHNSLEGAKVAERVDWKIPLQGRDRSSSLNRSGVVGSRTWTSGIRASCSVGAKSLFGRLKVSLRATTAGDRNFTLLPASRFPTYFGRIAQHDRAALVDPIRNSTQRQYNRIAIYYDNTFLAIEEWRSSSCAVR
jgi:hypothetical protein